MMSMMKNKKLMSLVAAGIGAAMVLFSLYAMYRIAEVKGEVGAVNQRISKGFVGKRVGGALNREASQYDMKVRLCFVVGAVLLVAGGLYYRKHRH